VPCVDLKRCGNEQVFFEKFGHVPFMKSQVTQNEKQERKPFVALKGKPG
jgi:hypothetical protein